MLKYRSLNLGSLVVRFQSTASSQLPSQKTSLLLRKLPPFATEQLLKDTFAASSVNFKKFELEPGCSLHFSNEAAADHAATVIKTQFNCDAFVSKISMPSLLLSNLSRSVSTEMIESTFSHFKLANIKLNNLTAWNARFTSASDCVKAMKQIDNLNHNGLKFKSTVVKTGESNYLLKINPTSGDRALSNAQIDEINGLLSSSLQGSSHVAVAPPSGIAANRPEGTSVMLRYPHLSDSDSLIQKLSELKINGQSLSIHFPSSSQVYQPLTKPTLYFRKVNRLGEKMINKFARDVGAEKVFLVRGRTAGSETPAESAVAYFSSPDTAQMALRRLKTSTIDSQSFNVSYRELVEPTVAITGLSQDATAVDVSALFAVYKPVEIRFVDHSETQTRTAYAIFEDPHQVDVVASPLMQGRYSFNGTKLNVTPYDYCDKGFEVVLPNNVSPKDLENALASADLTPLSTTANSNYSAFLAFKNMDDLTEAHKALTSGSVSLPVCSQSSSNFPTSKVTIMPAFALEVEGLPTSTPVSQLTDKLSEEFDGSQLLSSDRSGLMKFKRAKEISPSTKVLRSIELKDPSNPDAPPVRLSFSKFRPLEPLGGSDYDTIGDYEGEGEIFGEDIYTTEDGLQTMAKAKGKSIGALNPMKNDSLEAFDQMTLKSLMTDYFDSDPASRYEIVKNYFEQAVFDAKNSRTPMEALFEKNTSPELLKEAAEIFPRAQSGDAAAMKRLFSLYIQRSDMKRFTSDFEDLRTFFGPIDESDPFNWSQFNMDEPKAFMRVAQRGETIEKSRGFPFTSTLEWPSDVPTDSGKGRCLWDEDPSTKSKIDLNSLNEIKFVHSLESDDSSADADPNRVVQIHDTSGIRLPEPGQSRDDFMQPDDDEDDFKLDDKLRANKMTLSQMMKYETEDESQAVGEAKTQADNESDQKDVERDISSNRAGESYYYVPGLDSEKDNPNNHKLRTDDGQTWHGLILDNDIVKKTLPQNRMMTHRALVMIGNLRGVGGFGMGKGKNASMAVNAAYRDALRNLIYIDLYDNYGLAHDLYGKHNSCHVYLRATPRSRAIVASPFAYEILTRFGIGSVSCKVIGRRNPYSVARAIVDALSKHTNIDEIAKERGLRYMTLKWLQDQKM